MCYIEDKEKGNKFKNEEKNKYNQKEKRKKNTRRMNV